MDALPAFENKTSFPNMSSYFFLFSVQMAK